MPTNRPGDILSYILGNLTSLKKIDAAPDIKIFPKYYH